MEDEGFKVTKGEDSDIKVEQVDIAMTGYVSPEVLKRQEFKYYNNTYVYVSFRNKFIVSDDPDLNTKQEKTGRVKGYFSFVVKDELSKLKHAEKLNGMDVDEIKLKKTFSTHL